MFADLQLDLEGTGARLSLETQQTVQDNFLEAIS